MTTALTRRKTMLVFLHSLIIRQASKSFGSRRSIVRKNCFRRRMSPIVVWSSGLHLVRSFTRRFLKTGSHASPKGQKEWPGASPADHRRRHLHYCYFETIRGDSVNTTEVRVTGGWCGLDLCALTTPMVLVRENREIGGQQKRLPKGTGFSDWSERKWGGGFCCIAQGSSDYGLCSYWEMESDLANLFGGRCIEEIVSSCV